MKFVRHIYLNLDLSTSVVVTFFVLQIDKACKNDFVVSLLKMNELEGDIRSLGCELKTCEIELQAAQELLEKLESTVRKRLFELGVFTVAAAFTGGGKKVFPFGAKRKNILET